jgi:hypothetical protein
MAASSTHAAFLFVFGCSACVGGQSGTEGDKGIQCNVASTRALAADEVTAVGTPAEIATSLAGPRTMPLRWFPHDGSGARNTELELELVADLTSARYVSRHQGDCPENAKCTGCPDQVELDALLRFETADGAFSERFPGTLYADAETTRFVGTLPAVELRGTYDDSGVLSNYEDPAYSLHVWFSDSISGHLDLSGADPDPDPSRTLVSAAIAEFPAL